MVCGEGDGAELVGGAAEATELVAQGGFIERSFLGELEDLAGTDASLHLGAVAEMGGRGGKVERGVNGAAGVDVELPLFTYGDVTFEALAEGFVEGWVVGFENASAEGDGAHVEFAVLELDPEIAHDVEASTLFCIGVGCIFKDDTVSGFEGDAELVKLNGVARGLKDGADEGAAFFAEASTDEFLVIDAVHPA